jgi:penicillin-binding protein 1A
MRPKKGPKKMKMSRKQVDAVAETTASTVGSVFRLIFKILATMLLIFITTGLLFTCIFAYYVKTSLSSDLDITLTDVSLALSSTLWYTDSDGNYQELTTLHSTENRVWVEYENIPKYMEHAAVAIEDKRFYEHKGVDWYRTFGAFGNMFITMKNDFGGSTLTQQLIKNLTKQDDITVQRKLLEIFRALEFEKKYDKEEIIEWYLNTIYLGEGCYGIGTAANVYFDKEAWELSLAECASIIGITNNPSLYDPYISPENNKERQETILYEMYDQGYISYEEYQEAVNEELVLKRGADEVYQEDVYSYYVEVVIDDVINDLMEKNGLSESIAKQLVYSGGYNIYTCIDMDIQNQIDSVYTDLSQIPSGYTSTGQQLQSAIVIVDPYNGDIVGLSGGVGEKNANFILNRATGSQRPPGSSIKPISVYGPALDLGLITQNTLVNDSPNISLSGTSWYPRNSGGYSGIITIREGLRWSKNTVAAQVLDKLGIAASVDYLENRLGVTSLVESDYNYAPLALGQLTNGITVREMAQAYTAFVNDGIFTYSRTYTHVTDSDGNIVLDNQPETISAFKENTAWNITNMLQYAVSSGTGTEAYLSNMPVAGKTGTTTNDMDRYFVGYTPYYVAAVWTGYDTPAYMNVYGNPAAQIWKKIMGPIHENLEYKSFPTPTVGADTNIFGDLQPSESPEESESPDVTDTTSSPDPTPSHGPSEPPETDPPVTDPPVTDQPVTDPPITTHEPPVTAPPSSEPAA